MEPLTTIGLGIQGASLLGRLFSKSSAQRRRDAIANYKKAQLDSNSALIKTGVDRIGRHIQGQTASAREGARRRALAAGSPDAESFIAPAEERVQTAGSNAIQDFVDNQNARTTQNIANADLAEVTAPEDADALDFASELGGGIAEYGFNKEYANTLRQQPVGGTQPQGGNFLPNVDIGFNYNDTQDALTQNMPEANIGFNPDFTLSGNDTNGLAAPNLLRRQRNLRRPALSLR